MYKSKEESLFSELTTKSLNNNFWKVLIVDDEEDVHSITKTVFSNFNFRGRSIKFFNAYSAKEAKDIINKEENIALILLDVVMEEDDSGLKLVKYIREDVNNHITRIILRTGQPGYAPEENVIVDYDINDYKEKTELTSTKLISTVISAIRGYHDLVIIHEKDKLLISHSRQAVMVDIISMIAHQWRQPITAIAMGINNIILSIELDDLNPEDIKEDAERILEHTTNLSKNLNGFQNFFSSHSDKELLLVNDVVEAAFTIIEKKIENHNIELIKDYNSSSNINLCFTEFLQVILNILLNAVDALIEDKIQDPSIIIKTKEDDENVYISICDNADGISDNIIEHIFDPYFTTKNVKNGAGLGLYITKIIVEKHLRGTVDVRARQDKGVCFIVSIPLKSVEESKIDGAIVE